MLRSLFVSGLTVAGVAGMVLALWFAVAGLWALSAVVVATVLVSAWALRSARW